MFDRVLNTPLLQAIKQTNTYSQSFYVEVGKIKMCKESGMQKKEKKALNINSVKNFKLRKKYRHTIRKT